MIEVYVEVGSTVPSPLPPKRGMNGWRGAVILDFGSVPRRGLMVGPRVPCRNLAETKTRKEVGEDRPLTCLMKVIGSCLPNSNLSS